MEDFKIHKLTVEEIIDKVKFRTRYGRMNDFSTSAYLQSRKSRSISNNSFRKGNGKVSSLKHGLLMKTPTPQSIRLYLYEYVTFKLMLWLVGCIQMLLVLKPKNRWCLCHTQATAQTASPVFTAQTRLVLS